MLWVRIFRMFMKIYTKTGDKGTTGLFGSKRLSKADYRIESYGTLDELNCTIGLIIADLQSDKKETKELLSQIQTRLYEIMGFLAGAPIKLDYLDQETGNLEKCIDELQESLSPLHSFVLPQGSRISVESHIARTVCRRSERSLVRCLEIEKIDVRPYFPIFRYLNRLSDYFFILARSLNKKKEAIVHSSSHIDK